MRKPFVSTRIWLQKRALRASGGWRGFCFNENLVATEGPLSPWGRAALCFNENLFETEGPPSLWGRAALCFNKNLVETKQRGTLCFNENLVETERGWDSLFQRELGCILLKQKALVNPGRGRPSVSTKFQFD